MRCVLTVWSFALAVLVRAQLDIPTSVVLDGSQPDDRQVRGLSDPLTNDAAVSVDAARAGSMSFGIAVGTDTLRADLTPAPMSYSIGMSVTIVASDPNHAGAALDLNGLGARLIMKYGQVPLDSADLPVGMPARLVFDGDHFLLLNSTSRPCPVGYTAASSTFCISATTSSGDTFFNGAQGCADRGARLCSFSEWIYACRKISGFLATVTTSEWVDDAANTTNHAKTVGTGSNGVIAVDGFACDYGFSNEPTLTFPYRCCTSR